MDRTGYGDPLEQALKRELTRGERLKWQGKQLRRVNKTGFGIYLFAIPWTAFSLFWMAMASGFGSAGGGDGFLSMAFPLFGLPFVLIGLAMFASPLWPLFVAQKTIFAVTDKRVIRLRLGNSLKVEDVSPEQIGRISKKELSDGTGTITIVTGTYVSNRGRARDQTFKLGEVENVHGAGEAITDLAEAGNPDGDRV